MLRPRRTYGSRRSVYDDLRNNDDALIEYEMSSFGGCRGSSFFVYLVTFSPPLMEKA
jgi:hypothetical protein